MTRVSKRRLRQAGFDAAGDQGLRPARCRSATISSKVTSRWPGSSTWAPIDSVLLVGPMLPATKRGLSGVRRRELVGGAAGQLGGRAVELDDVLVQVELGHATARWR